MVHYLLLRVQQLTRPNRSPAWNEPVLPSLVKDFAATTNAAASLLAHRLAQCTRASKCGRLCRHLMKSPGVGMVYCVGFTFPASPPPPDKKHVDELGRIFSLYDALEDPDFPCPLGLF